MRRDPPKSLGTREPGTAIGGAQVAPEPLLRVGRGTAVKTSRSGFGSTPARKDPQSNRPQLSTAPPSRMQRAAARTPSTSRSPRCPACHSNSRRCRVRSYVFGDFGATVPESMGPPQADLPTLIRQPTRACYRAPEAPCARQTRTFALRTILRSTQTLYRAIQAADYTQPPGSGNRH